MAASSQLLDLQQISDITECSICTETFTDPKVLPCVHTFCLKCLLKFGEHDKPGDQVACPLCRTKFVIPPGGFAALPNNFFVNKLLLAHQLNSTSVTVQTHPCELCMEDEISASADVYCIECELHFCEKCCARHRKSKANKKHEIVSVEDKPSPDALLKMTASYCAQHPDEQIKFYCYDCRTITCVMCQVTEHNKHECSDIKKSAEEFRKQLDDDIEKVTSCAQRSRDTLQQLERDSEGFLEHFAVTQRAISSAYDKLKSLLDSHQRKLVEELNILKIKRLKEVECRRDELKRKCMIVESFKKYCEEMKEKGTACDISRDVNDLHTRSAELVDAQEQYNRQLLDRVELKFTPSSTMLTSAANLIGAVDCTVDSVAYPTTVAAADQPFGGVMKTAPRSDPSLQPASRPVPASRQPSRPAQPPTCTQPGPPYQQTTQPSRPIQPSNQRRSLTAAEEFTTKSQVAQVLQCAGAVYGIAQLGTELFVCTHRSERITVYDLNTCSETRHVTVPGMQQPLSLTACQQNNCLYISDYALECIHRVNLSNNPCSKWSLKSDPRGVSLTGAFNLLVTLLTSIAEYHTSGALIRSIRLDMSLDNPQHSIELSSGLFVVCHAGSAQHRVCVVNKAGRIVHSYGGPRGPYNGQLHRPFSLAVNSLGYVFAADCRNDRVVVLSPTLTRLGDVATVGHRLCEPCTLHLDEINACLYVGDLTASRVLVIAV